MFIEYLAAYVLKLRRSSAAGPGTGVCAKKELVNPQKQRLFGEVPKERNVSRDLISLLTELEVVRDRVAINILRLRSVTRCCG